MKFFCPFSSFLWEVTQNDPQGVDVRSTISSLQTNTDIFDKSADPDEMAHQDLHCLSFSYWILTQIPICNNDCVRLPRWKSPCQRNGAESVNKNSNKQDSGLCKRHLITMWRTTCETLCCVLTLKACTSSVTVDYVDDKDFDQVLCYMSCALLLKKQNSSDCDYIYGHNFGWYPVVSIISQIIVFAPNSISKESPRLLFQYLRVWDKDKTAIIMIIAQQ